MKISQSKVSGEGSRSSMSGRKSSVSLRRFTVPDMTYIVGVMTLDESKAAVSYRISVGWGSFVN